MSQGLCRGTVGWPDHRQRSIAPVGSASVLLHDRPKVFLLSQLLPDGAVGDRRLDVFNECPSRGVLRSLCRQRDQDGFGVGCRVLIVGKSHASMVGRSSGRVVTGWALAANPRDGACYAWQPSRRGGLPGPTPVTGTGPVVSAWAPPRTGSAPQFEDPERGTCDRVLHPRDPREARGQ